MTRGKMILAALACALIPLAVLGAGKPDIGLNRGTEVGLSSALGDRGVAKWSTVELFMTTESLVDTTWGKGMRLPNSPDSLDTRRVYNANELLKHTGIVIKRLGEDSSGNDYDVPTFAVADIDSSTPAGYRNASGTQNVFTGRAGSGSLLNPIATDTGKWHLIYVPWETFIPASSTIVSARVNVQLSATWYIANTDSMVAVQMTNPNDSWWYKQKLRGVSNYWNYSQTSYSRQFTSFWGGASVNAHPWSPALKDRAKLWDWGTVMDWSSTTSVSSTTVAKSPWNIDVTDCVQHSVSGGVNNGIAITYLDKGATTDENFYQWDNRGGNNARRCPYIYVKYITRKEQPMFPGGKRWAFVYQTDDAVKDYNNAINDTMLAHGGKYTIYATKNFLGTTNRATSADLYRWWQNGNEIGTHSKSHASGGMHQYVAASRSDTTGAGWTNLKAEMTPAWLVAIGDSIGGGLSDSQRWAKSMACPENVWDPLIILASQRLGYKSMRAGQLGNYVLGDHTAPANYYSVATDSLRTGATSWRARYARNMSTIGTTVAVSDIVGTDAANPTEVAVKANARRIIQTIKAQDRGVLSLYSHDTKASNYNVAELDLDELGWICQVVDNEGGAYMTASEYADWIKANATYVASPVRATQPDTLRFDAAAKVWARPDGIDTRWIRNVK